MQVHTTARVAEIALDHDQSDGIDGGPREGEREGGGGSPAGLNSL